MEVRPDRQEFLKLARDFDVVPVVQELTSDTVTPFTVYSRLAANGRNPFLLESVEGGERAARYSFVGADPFRIVEVRGETVFVDGAPRDGSPIEELRRATDFGSVAQVDGLPPFAGGAMGYLGYDAVRLVAEATRRAGLNRPRIRDAVRDIAPWRGVAGIVRWDTLGRNERPVGLATWRGGRLQPLPASDSMEQ